MDRFYFDIEVKLPAAALNRGVEKVYRVIHGILSGMGEYRPQVGLSFPNWQPGKRHEHVSLGKIIRVVGTKDELRKLYSHTELCVLCEKELIFIDPILPVPEDAQEVVYKRDRIIERRHRKLKSGEISKEDYVAPEVIFPFVNFKSKSTGRHYRYYIRMDKVDKRVPGGFNDYGLGVDGTSVPIF